MPFGQLNIFPGDQDWQKRVFDGGMFGGGLFGDQASGSAPPVATAPVTGNWSDRVITAMQDPMAQIGLRLLANSRQPNGAPTRLGPALGNAVLGYQQSQAEAGQSALQRKLLEAQIAKMQQPEQVKQPTSITEYEYAKQNGFTGSYSDWLTNGSPATTLPSNVSEALWYEKATPEQRAIYDKQNGRELSPYFQWVQRVLPDGSTQQGTFDARTGITTWDQAVVPPGTKPRVDAAGRTEGETQATALIDLPRVIDNASQAKKVIGDLLSHPGAPRIFGLQGAVPNFPGSQASDAQALLDQIKGKTFLEAFNSLRGAGQITEIEGHKATIAIGRLQKEQSWKAAQNSLNELIKIVDDGVARAIKKSQRTGTISRGTQEQPAPKPRIRVDENANVVN